MVVFCSSHMLQWEKNHYSSTWYVARFQV
jgi:hypothetical protein